MKVALLTEIYYVTENNVLGTLTTKKGKEILRKAW